MALNTSSAVISFYSKMEDEVSEFYERLAENPKSSAGRDTFAALAKENRLHKELVQRAYREVITDALEACFAFTMNENDYTIDTDVSNSATYLDIIMKAIQIEETNRRFCLDASEKSKSLMSDVPEAFARVAKKKLVRMSKLQSLEKT